MRTHGRLPRISTILILLSLAASVLLNFAAWMSTAFSDWYAEEAFSVVTAPLLRLTGAVPFSVGEWMLIAAFIWLLLGVLLLVWAALCLIVRARRRSKGAPAAEEMAPGTGRNGGSGTTGPARGISWIARRFLRATLWLTAVFLPVMTLNCFLLYRTSPVETQLSGYGEEYTVAELGALRDYVVERCNALAQVVPRGEDGEVLYEGGDAAMKETAKAAVAALGARAGEDAAVPERFRRLGGFQTTPKGLVFSELVSQQYIQGYYFPFSMEANYNTVMKITNAPFTMCHELSHTHGFILEDESNLIGFLACINADDAVFQYSGWLGILNYVNNSFYENVDEATYRSHVHISAQVREDNQFLSEEAWEEVEEKAVLSTETVKAATDTYLDTTLKTFGVESGKASYSHVVELLLMYYDGNYDGQAG